MNTIAEVQAALDKLPALMSEKGLRDPVAEYTLIANCGAKVWLSYKNESAGISRGYEHFQNTADAEAWIAGLPSVEEARKLEFMTQLAKTIEMGKDHHIDVQFVNPLIEAMKRLSENAITHQRSP